MALTTLSSLILSDPNYRFALLYNIVDTTVCEALENTFGQVKVRFQIKIDKKNINVKFFYLDKYFLTYLKVNEKDVVKSIKEKIFENRLSPKNYYNIFFHYVSN
jgi:hypothetical protein